MSEFIFKSAVFRKRHDVVISSLKKAKAKREIAIDVELEKALAHWESTEGARLRKEQEERDERTRKAEQKEIDEAKAEEAIKTRRKEIMDRAISKHAGAKHAYEIGGFLYKMFNSLESLGYYEKKAFYAADWSRKSGEWMPPNFTDDEDFDYEERPYRMRDWGYLERRPQRPERYNFRNQFTVFIGMLNPLSDALTIGASEVRLDDKMMTTFLQAEEESAEYIKENTDAD